MGGGGAQFFHLQQNSRQGRQFSTSNKNSRLGGGQPGNPILPGKYLAMAITWQAPKLPGNQVITWQVRALVPVLCTRIVIHYCTSLFIYHSVCTCSIAEASESSDHMIAKIVGPIGGVLFITAIVLIIIYSYRRGNISVGAWNRLKGLVQGDSSAESI